MISDKPSLAIGELTDSQVVGRNRAGGASNVEAYQHWIEGSQQPLDIDFSDANVSSSLSERIAESAAGRGQARSFQTAINQSLANNGAPAFVNTTATIDTGGAVIGRADTELRGWVTTNGGKWEFEGYVAGKPEQFDFNPDPDRGWVKDKVTRALDAVGGAIGAAGYPANYTGSIAIRASGNIRR